MVSNSIKMFKKESVIITCLVLLFGLSVLVGTIRRPQSAGPGMPSTVSLSRQPGVAVVPLYGTIEVSSGEWWVATGIDSVIHALNAIETEKAVKAVVIRVNSPGGHVGSSQELFQEIIAFKKKSKKPVVISIVDYGASGAYWVALAGDSIFANPGSMVGSMGVITQTMDFSEVKEKYGVGMRTYKSAALKDMLNPWRAPTKQENAVIAALLKNIHRQFVDVVMTRRKMSRKKAERLADGRIYTGEQALKEGLIDNLGGLEAAIRHAGKLAGIKGRPRIIRKYRGGLRQIFQNLRGQRTQFPILPRSVMF